MKKTIAFPILVLLLLAVAATPVLAAPVAQDAEPDPVADALADFVALIGLGTAVSTLVQALKAFGLIPDGYGGQVTVALNLLIYIAAFIAGWFGVDVGDEAVKQALFHIGQAITAVLTALMFFSGMRKADIFGFRKRQKV